ncbi:MAG: hypothetical protein FJW98_04320, partial [Actinobacteria bacterium]|nr:hypothetical protein [Actinomycetota bacterium]
MKFRTSKMCPLMALCRLCSCDGGVRPAGEGRRTMRTRTLMTGVLATVMVAAVASAAPVRAADAAPVAANGSVAAGLNHSCAITAVRAVKCWGDNMFGQLGTGDFDSSATARTVAGLGDVTRVQAGRDHTCALT